MCLSDIDECSYAASSPCPAYSQCLNAMGSYSCECEFGYEAVGSVCEGNIIIIIIIILIAKTY